MIQTSVCIMRSLIAQSSNHGPMCCDSMCCKCFQHPLWVMFGNFNNSVLKDAAADRRTGKSLVNVGQNGNE